LHPSLDAALFCLKAGGLSEIQESDMGLHLLWCRAVRPPETLSLEAARPHILKVMKSRFREQWMREWIASLESPIEGTQDHERQRQ
jgi:parvulin-like peptidyl-prolyl isomerase